MPVPTWLRSTPRRRAQAGPALSVRPLLEALEDRHLLSVFTVTTVADSGPGSLRQAILDSDNSPGQTNTIDFAVAGSGVRTIAPLSPLPAVTSPADIDGTSQPGFANSPLIDLNGANAGPAAVGLALLGGGSSVRGLAVNGFDFGVLLASGNGNLLDQDYVGTDASGGSAAANAYGVVVAGSSNNVIGRSVLSGNAAYGVLVTQGSGNRIGSDLIGTDAAGTTALGNGFAGVGLLNGAANNLVYADLLSGNGAFGAILDGTATLGNQVYANYVGLSLTGAALGNGSAGVMVESGAAGNTVGGAGAGAGNVVSGNGGVGVFLYSGAHNNVVEGNRVGTDVGGGAALGNATDGVQIAFAGSNLLLGNVLSGNGRVGALLGGDGADGNILAANFIGTNAAGSAAVANALAGVYVYAGASGGLVGTAGAGNVISGNQGAGVDLEPTSSGTPVEGNRIGTNAAGTAALANATYGVLDRGTNDTVGGTAAGAGNLISGNRGDGVHLAGSNSLVEGNYVGTNAAGTAALGNGADGVRLDSGANSNTVGGTGPGAGNTISGNTFQGVEIVASGNLVEGNRIGTNADGTAALGNVIDGVLIRGSGNTVGGTAAGAGNLISGNTNNGALSAGVFVLSGSGNLVEGNRIGTNADGTAALANGNNGVVIDTGANDNNTIGGAAAGAGNLISGNTNNGVEIFSNGNSILVEGNTIGANAAGTAALANGNDGVLIDTFANGNTIGGTAAGAGNLISGNTNNGVDLAGSANTVEGNRIGTNAVGTAALANTKFGVEVTGNNNSIGGAAAGAGNVISGNGAQGVLVLGATGTLIQGNDIGTEADGVTALANGDDGVFITSLAGNVAANNTVGGNVIAFNHGDGVLVGSDARFTVPAGTGNKVSQNSIFSNTQIGIDLGPDDGVTPNDSTGHSGPNNFQDFPVITSAFNSGGGVTTVNYSLTETANVHYTVEFFVSPSADPSGFGQGKAFVGSAVVFSSVSGTFPQQANLTGNFAGQFVTATATDASGNTSEFSNAFQVTGGA